MSKRYEIILKMISGNSNVVGAEIGVNIGDL